jgi:hypothetical protein
VSGYLRADADAWEPEHYARAAWLGRARSAPAWWIGMDIAWQVDRRKLPTARAAAEHWCVDKNKAARLIREGVEQQAAWEQRADRKAAILRILEEWASKEPKRATAARVGTQSGQGVFKGDTPVGTGDTDDQRIVGPASGQGRDTTGTGEGQGRDTHAGVFPDQPPTYQPPVDTVSPPAAAGGPPAPPPAPPLPAAPGGTASVAGGAASPVKPKPPDDALTLWLVYRQHRLDLPLLRDEPGRPAPDGRKARPHLGLTPTTGSRKLLRTLLAEAGDFERAGRHLAWVFESLDERAMQLRAEAPWPGGDVVFRADLNGIVVAEKLPGRLEMTDRWEARGRTPLATLAEHRARDAPTERPSDLERVGKGLQRFLERHKQPATGSP